MGRSVGLIVEFGGNVKPSEDFYKKIGIKDFYKINVVDSDYLSELKWDLPIDFYLSDLSLVQGNFANFSKFLEMIKNSNSNLHLLEQKISTNNEKGKVFLELLISLGRNEKKIRDKFRKN